jgi:hypothetical protein
MPPALFTLGVFEMGSLFYAWAGLEHLSIYVSMWLG